MAFSSCSVSGCCLRSSGCGFGGVCALVSIVWFAAFNVTCVVLHVFLLDSGLESIARVVLVPTAKRDTQPSSFSPRKTSFIFLFPWLACAFHNDGTCGMLWYFLGDSFRKRSRIQGYLVLQWIHIYVSLQWPCRPRSTRKFSIFLELTSGFVPGSSLCLVRQRIHLRWSTRRSRRLRSTRKLGFFWETTSGFIPVFSASWFNSGYSSASVCEVVQVFPADAQRWLPMVQTVRRTIETPQLHVNKVIDAPVMQFVRVPRSSTSLSRRRF